MEHIARRLTEGRSRFEFYLPLAGGGRMPVVISAREIEDPDGRLFAVVTVTDISEQKRAELDLRHANVKLEARAREIEEELLLAARVQESLAPRSLTWGGVSVETFYQAARTIGGDYGLVTPREEYLNIMVCDVSGHGISSALVANRIYTETVAQIESGTDLGSMLRHLNRFTMQSLGISNLFFTLAAARLYRGARSMEFAGAGHPPAMILRHGQAPLLLESRSTILGLLDDAVNREPVLRVAVESGDRVMIYTDGLTENFNARREMLGVEGLAEIARETSKLPLAEMRQELLNRVAAWREGPAVDDVSLVLLEIP